MAPARSLRNRKKQARLQFQPIDSSSPATSQYSQDVRDRLAKVRYSSSASKVIGKSAGESAGQDRGEYEDGSLLTPEPSSQPELMNPDTSSPLSSLRTSPAVPPQFVEPNHPLSSEEDDIVLPPSKRRRTSISPDNSNAFNIEQDRRSSRLQNRPKIAERYDGSSSDEVVASTPARRSTRLAQISSPVLRSHSISSSSRSVPTKKLNTTKELSDLGSAESSEDDVMATQPLQKRKPIRQSIRAGDDFVVADDDVELIRSGADSPVKATARKRKPRDNFIVNDDEVLSIASSEERQTHPTTSQNNPRIDKAPKSPKTPRNRSRKEQAELEEDVLDLQDSDVNDSTRKSRTRGGPVTTERDKTKEHLALLKRRRAGKRVIRILDSEDDEGDGDISHTSDGIDIDDIVREDEVERESYDDLDSLIGRPPMDEEPIWIYENDEEDDFVVEDNATEGRLGRPDSGMPLQFTSFASAKPRELFPHIIEWMVKNKISPSFERHDDVYHLSFARIDDQVKAQAGSRLISAAWNATFKHSIIARPRVNVTALPGMDEDNIRTCDACNKTNHPARYDFTFSGKAYFKDSLEPVDESDEDETAEPDIDVQDDNVSRDEQGHDLASKNIHFYLGRFCAANAQMGHKLTHWKYNLNENVLSYLEGQGVLSMDAIVMRDKWNKKKREKEAERIVDAMQETGVIAELWQGFKDDLDDARIGMEGHESKRGRNSTRIGSVRVRRNNGLVGEWNEGGKFTQVARVESDSEGE